MRRLLIVLCVLVWACKPETPQPPAPRRPPKTRRATADVSSVGWRARQDAELSVAANRGRAAGTGAALRPAHRSRPEPRRRSPAVAARWEVLDGGKAYVLHLDPRANFSDGTPVRAQRRHLHAQQDLRRAVDAVRGVVRGARPRADQGHRRAHRARRLRRAARRPALLVQHRRDAGARLRERGLRQDDEARRQRAVRPEEARARPQPPAGAQRELLAREAGHRRRALPAHRRRLRGLAGLAARRRRRLARRQRRLGARER